MIRVIDVRGFRTPEQRATVCYVGRPFAGWPASPWANPYWARPGFDAVRAYREHLVKQEAKDPAAFAASLRLLWDQAVGQKLALGCWCGRWWLDVSPPEPEFCHGIVLAKLLKERFGGAQ